MVGSYRTSNQIYIFFIMMFVALTIGSFLVVAPGRELEMAVFLAAVWGLILFILIRFKIEIYEKHIRYRKLLFTHEVVFSNVAGFYGGEKKSSLNRPLALEIRMKHGIKPSKHLIGFNLLSKDGQAHLVDAFRAKGLPEEES